jgi:DNA mismatch repair protein MutL
MSIRQLPDDLVNRIAAGEVVERPASVIKELVENAIDAGASRIKITTAKGGTSLMRIEDDGHGMNGDDLVLCVERHATSKLMGDDLDDIASLGFRGEALASIGAVARLIISSRPKDADTGLRLEVHQSKKTGPTPHGMNKGTIIEVHDLFADVPARLKFLKSERAEGGAITEIVKRLALSNPEVHFVLEGSDRSTQNWPAQSGPGALAARVAQVMGPDFVDNAVPLGLSRHGVVVAGLAGLPTFTRANSLNQFYFVNGRAVRDKVLLSAVRGAYADFIFRDRFPVIALFVAIDPGEVDVNVHPAKAELRFRDQGAVRSAVYRAIQEALAAAGFKAASSVAEAAIDAFRAPNAPAQATQGAQAASAPPYAAPLRENYVPPALEGLTEPSARFDADTSGSALYAPQQAEAPPADYPLGVARAQMFKNFIVAQNGDALVLVDQHAAHERLVYEKFKAERAAGAVPSQAQLIPMVIELPAEDCDRLEQAAPALQELGLYLDRFGEAAIAVHETPAVLGRTDIGPLIKDLADGLAEWGHVDILGERMDAVIARMACHGSVRSGRQLRPDEMNALLRDMENTPHSGQCIHGRPTYVELKLTDIEKLFGRR